MGDILNIKCNCGFEIDSIGIGGGMNGVSQLYSCKKCQNFGVTHSSLTYVKCDNCSKSIFKKLLLLFVKEEKKEKDGLEYYESLECLECQDTRTIQKFSEYEEECSKCGNEIEFISSKSLGLHSFGESYSEKMEPVEVPCPKCFPIWLFLPPIALT